MLLTLHPTQHFSVSACFSMCLTLQNLRRRSNYLVSNYGKPDAYTVIAARQVYPAFTPLPSPALLSSHHAPRPAFSIIFDKGFWRATFEEFITILSASSRANFTTAFVDCYSTSGNPGRGPCAMAQDLLLPALSPDLPSVSCVVTTAEWGDVFFVSRVRFETYHLHVRNMQLLQASET